jgi:DNA-binding NtrC family response regulator
MVKSSNYLEMCMNTNGTRIAVAGAAGRMGRRMVALADAETTLHLDAVSPCILQAVAEHETTNDAEHVTVSLHAKLPSALEAVEREMIKAALTTHAGHAEDTARALGISRKGLYLKRQRLGL